MLPDADLAGSCLLARWITWTVFVDEYFDATFEHGIDESVLLAQALNVVHAPMPPVGPACDPLVPRSHVPHPLVPPLAALWRETQRWAPPAALGADLADHVLGYVSGCINEASHRRLGVVPTVESTVTDRRDTVACGIYFDIITLALGLDIPEPIYAGNDFQALRRLATDAIVLINDVHSAAKEAQAGDVHNLAILISRANHCSLREAAEEVARRAEMCAEAFVDRSKALRKTMAKHHLSPASEDTVWEAVRALEHSVAGTNAWQRTSQRYQDPPGPPLFRAHISPARQPLTPISDQVDRSG